MPNDKNSKYLDVSSSQIMGLTEQHLTPLIGPHKLHRITIDAFLSMQKAAASENIDIQVCSSFRSFDRQLSIWNKKWRGELPLLSLNGEVLDTANLSDEQKIHAIMLWSALPGASRHHWGTDFDVYDRAEVTRRKHQFELVPAEYENGGPCAELSNWISDNAATFGFYLPYSKYTGGVAREPWHLSHKMVANKIISDFDLDSLLILLKKSEILGKEQILKQLPDLVERYTYNKGL